jgi:hypothetical protein
MTPLINASANTRRRYVAGSAVGLAKRVTAEAIRRLWVFVGPVAMCWLLLNSAPMTPWMTEV